VPPPTAHAQQAYLDHHAATQAQHQVQGGLLLDVVIGQRAAVLQLLARKDQALLVGGDALLVLRRFTKQQSNSLSMQMIQRGGTNAQEPQPLPPESWPSHSRWCRWTPPPA
jgi:hypothetical protein